MQKPDLWDRYGFEDDYDNLNSKTSDKLWSEDPKDYLWQYFKYIVRNYDLDDEQTAKLKKKIDKLRSKV